MEKHNRNKYMNRLEGNFCMNELSKQGRIEKYSKSRQYTAKQLKYELQLEFYELLQENLS